MDTLASEIWEAGCYINGGYVWVIKVLEWSLFYVPHGDTALVNELADNWLRCLTKFDTKIDAKDIKVGQCLCRRYQLRWWAALVLGAAWVQIPALYVERKAIRCKVRRTLKAFLNCEVLCQDRNLKYMLQESSSREAISAHYKTINRQETQDEKSVLYDLIFSEQTSHCNSKLLSPLTFRTVGKVMIYVCKNGRVHFKSLLKAVSLYELSKLCDEMEKKVQLISPIGNPSTSLPLRGNTDVLKTLEVYFAKRSQRNDISENVTSTEIESLYRKRNMDKGEDVLKEDNSIKYSEPGTSGGNKILSSSEKKPKKAIESAGVVKDCLSEIGINQESPTCSRSASKRNRTKRKRFWRVTATKKDEVNEVFCKNSSMQEHKVYLRNDIELEVNEEFKFTCLTPASVSQARVLTCSNSNSILNTLDDCFIFKTTTPCPVLATSQVTSNHVTRETDLSHSESCTKLDKAVVPNSSFNSFTPQNLSLSLAFSNNNNHDAVLSHSSDEMQNLQCIEEGNQIEEDPKICSLVVCSSKNTVFSSSDCMSNSGIHGIQLENEQGDVINVSKSTESSYCGSQGHKQKMTGLDDLGCSLQTLKKMGFSLEETNLAEAEKNQIMKFSVTSQNQKFQVGANENVLTEKSKTSLCNPPESVPSALEVSKTSIKETICHIIEKLDCVSTIAADRKDNDDLKKLEIEDMNINDTQGSNPPSKNCKFDLGIDIGTSSSLPSELNMPAGMTGGDRKIQHSENNSSLLNMSDYLDEGSFSCNSGDVPAPHEVVGNFKTLPFSHTHNSNSWCCKTSLITGEILCLKLEVNDGNVDPQHVKLSVLLQHGDSISVMDTVLLRLPEGYALHHQGTNCNGSQSSNLSCGESVIGDLDSFEGASSLPCELRSKDRIYYIERDVEFPLCPLGSKIDHGISGTEVESNLQRLFPDETVVEKIKLVENHEDLEENYVSKKEKVFLKPNTPVFRSKVCTSTKSLKSKNIVTQESVIKNCNSQSPISSQVSSVGMGPDTQDIFKPQHDPGIHDLSDTETADDRNTSAMPYPSQISSFGLISDSQANLKSQHELGVLSTLDKIHVIPVVKTAFDENPSPMPCPSQVSSLGMGPDTQDIFKPQRDPEDFHTCNDIHILSSYMSIETPKKENDMPRNWDFIEDNSPLPKLERLNSPGPKIKKSLDIIGGTSRGHPCGAVLERSQNTIAFSLQKNEWSFLNSFGPPYSEPTKISSYNYFRNKKLSGTTGSQRKFLKIKAMRRNINGKSKAQKKLNF